MLLRVFTKNIIKQNAAPYSFATFKEKIAKKQTIKEGSAADVQKYNYISVMSDAGLKSYLQKTYTTTGGAILGMLFTSQLALKTGLYPHGIWSSIGVGILGIGSLIGAMKIQPQHVTNYVNGEQQLKTINPFSRVALFGIGFGIFGLMSAPLFGWAARINPNILPMAMFLSSAVFGTASAYAYLRPSGSLLGWGSALQTGIISLILLQLSGFIYGAIAGPNMFSMMVHRFDTVFGIGLFSAFVGYDTQVAIAQYQAGNADHLQSSIQFVLDFWNILTRMVELLGIFSSD